MEISELKARVRTEHGKGPAGRLRRQGLLPAVLYGPRAVPVHLTVDRRALLALLKQMQEHIFIKLLIEENGNAYERLSIVKELQTDPVTGWPLHVDFYEISMDRTFHFDLPLHFTGTPVGVSEEQGELLHLKRDVRVSCLPSQLPEFLELDISGLHVGDSLKVQDLTILAGVIVHEQADTALVTVVAQRAAEVEEGQTEAPPAPELTRQKGTEEAQ